MSGGKACTCKKLFHVTELNWEVPIGQRKVNHSCFNERGGRAVPSNYSYVYCKVCKAMWRSKAAYVDRLPDEKQEKL
jgi:hypothetical protein